MKNLWESIPPIFKNFYIVTITLFVIWMCFFDDNDFYTQYLNNEKYDELLQEKRYYQNKIEEVNQDRRSLRSNEEALERFAREKYLLRKRGEDIYIVTEE